MLCVPCLTVTHEPVKCTPIPTPNQIQTGVCITKTEKAESEAQRGKPKGTLESESRDAIV